MSAAIALAVMTTNVPSVPIVLQSSSDMSCSSPRHSAEERIRERPALFRGAIHVRYALLPSRFVDEPKRKSLCAYALDHRDERIFRKALDQVRTAVVHVDHPWDHVHVTK